MTLRNVARRLRQCPRGAMAIETAVVAPVLAVLSIGTFEVGTAVSRQQELQSGASEAESIILAAAGGTGTESDDIELVIEESLGLDADQVSLEQRFRCNDAEEMELAAADCGTTTPIYRYVRLEITDSYTPVWANFGVGEAFTYEIERTIQVE